MFRSLAKDIYHRFLTMLPPEQSLQMQYFQRNLEIPNLRRPVTLSEKILRRKMLENDDRFAALADKVRAKDYVAKLIGEQYVIKTLWAGKQLPDDIANWKRPMVIKANHGNDWNIFVREGDRIDWDDVRRECARWVNTEFWPWLNERWYNRMDRQILVEEFIGDGVTPPPDYKFFVFDGEVKVVQVDVARFGEHRRNLYTPDWKQIAGRITYEPTDAPLEPPEHYGLMLELAAKLGAGFDFVRVDLYDLPDGPKFGEMTFSPGSGNKPFTPRALDVEVGSYWRD